MAASKLLEHKERLVSVVDVHDAMLALVRAVAMRDSYTTLRDILSDVPLAVMCMPKPNNDTLTNVISGLAGIRDMFVAQVQQLVSFIISFIQFF